ncbi:hypothetical protein JL720_6193 [Aureococcus anophagefferens]|nr:hypothetical protein JL720_6193 [Aureococcus anophagefferens]
MSWRAAVVVSSALAFDEFRCRLPNGQRLEALGHVSAAGGGARNSFGDDFAAAGFAWTPWLCEADSDGDGQSNGFELGDPCCCWEAEAAWALQQAPYFPPEGGGPQTGHVYAYSKHKLGELPRKHGVSLPGDASSTSPANDDEDGACDCAAVHAAARRALAASSDEKARRSGVVPFDVATVPLVNLVAGLSRRLSLALALVIAAFLPAFDAFGFVRRVGFAGTVQLFLASALYIDVTGLLLHLVLDNSNNERFSLLAGGVRSFVNHHADPQKIAATPGLHYAFTHLPVAAAIFAHRWSHTPAFAVPTVARVLERAGLLIAPAKHARHHVPPHASNFSIMMGWADKLVNPFLRLAPGGPWSPVWLYVFVAWLVSPVFLTDPKVSRRFLAAWRALCLRRRSAAAPAVLKTHGAAGRGIWVVAAAACLTGAAHVGSSSLILDLGICSGTAAASRRRRAAAAAKAPAGDASRHDAALNGLLKVALRVQRTRAAPDEAALWDDEAGGALADVDLADLDDVDALYDARRRCDAALVCAARAGLRPAELCVDAPPEAIAILATRRASAASPRTRSRRPRRSRRRCPGRPVPGARRAAPARDKGAIGASATASSSRATGRARASRRERPRTKVSASRRKFLEKRDAARAEAAPRSKPRRSRTPASAALRAAGGGGDLDGDLGGVFATADDAAAASPPRASSPRGGPAPGALPPPRTRLEGRAVRLRRLAPAGARRPGRGGVGRRWGPG